MPHLTLVDDDDDVALLVPAVAAAPVVTQEKRSRAEDPAPAPISHESTRPARKHTAEGARPAPRRGDGIAKMAALAFGERGAAAPFESIPSQPAAPFVLAVEATPLRSISAKGETPSTLPKLCSDDDIPATQTATADVASAMHATTPAKPEAAPPVAAAHKPCAPKAATTKVKAGQGKPTVTPTIDAFFAKFRKAP